MAAPGEGVGTDVDVLVGDVLLARFDRRAFPSVGFTPSLLDRLNFLAFGESADVAAAYATPFLLPPLLLLFPRFRAPLRLAAPAAGGETLRYRAVSEIFSAVAFTPSLRVRRSFLALGESADVAAVVAYAAPFLLPPTSFFAFGGIPGGDVLRARADTWDARIAVGLTPSLLVRRSFLAFGDNADVAATFRIAAPTLTLLSLPFTFAGGDALLARFARTALGTLDSSVDRAPSLLDRRSRRLPLVAPPTVTRANPFIL